MAGKRFGLAASRGMAALMVFLAGLPAACVQGQDAAGQPAASSSDPPPDWRPKGLGAYLAARQAEIRGDTAAAATYYPLALAQDPDNVSLLRRAYFFTATEGDIATAATLAERLVRQDPGASVAPLVLVTDLVAQGRLAEASKRLSALSAQGLNSFLVPVMQAWIRLGLGDAAGARTALDALDGNAAYRSLKALHGALIHDVEGDEAGARALFTDYLASSNRPSLRGVQLAGGFFARHGDRERARALAADYAQRFPDSVLLENTILTFKGGALALPVATPAHGLAELFYGTASLLSDNDSQTAAMFNRLALYLRPDFALARLLMGQLLTTQGRYEDALAFFRPVANEPGLDLAAALAEAESLRAARRVDEAIAVLEGTAARHPERADPLIDLGDLLRQEERFPEAVAAYTRGLARLSPVDSRHWTVFFGRGVALERSDRWPEAERDFKRALELSPQQPYVLNYLGYSWVDKGENIDEAKRMIERAVTLRPKDGYIIDSLGWAHYRLGEYDQAVKWLERAIREAPEDPTINDHLGDAYWVVGRKREARFQWERTLTLSAEPALAEAVRQKLDHGLTPPEPVKRARVEDAAAPSGDLPADQEPAPPPTAPPPTAPAAPTL
ncbi:tetratricopeptide repeat protein [Pararhodospirillum oryzae]|uniref:Uncharacterized protein n=1 Tax=Pararhodospirillum oryzae TaxID=478448 RepID=A0A512HAM1_9PROT|nr:tetratricopeptide repeat protein [Pararhodospirillum oryzae]GEO82503.1 hypothetical protein ROR02_26340 [Pararhodospirillum oryzae]